jgi:hypothetical protein
LVEHDVSQVFQSLKKMMIYNHVTIPTSITLVSKNIHKLCSGGKNKFTTSWAQWKKIMKSNISLLKIMSHKYMAINGERNSSACDIIAVVTIKGTEQGFPLLWALTLYIQGALHY